MRLIDADKLKEYLDKKYSFGIDLKFMLFDEIDNQPTAYDIDKVVEEIGVNTKCVGIDSIDCPVKYCWDCEEHVISQKKAIEIINEQLKENK